MGAVEDLFTDKWVNELLGVRLICNQLFQYVLIILELIKSMLRIDYNKVDKK